MYINIEAERVRKQWTQEDISQKLGITRKTYYLKQLNESFTNAELQKLSNIFQCPVDYLTMETANSKHHSRKKL